MKWYSNNYVYNALEDLEHEGEDDLSEVTSKFLKNFMGDVEIALFAISKDQKRIFWVDMDGVCRIFSIKLGIEVKNFRVFPKKKSLGHFKMTGVHLTPCNRYFYIYGENGGLIKVCLKRFCVIKKFRRVTKNDILNATTTSDGRYLYLVGENGFMGQYDSITGKLVKRYKKSHKSDILAIKTFN